MARWRACACVSCPAHPGSCPELTTARHCDDCASAHEQRRGTRQQRGYDAQHERIRRTWKPKVEAGLVDCHANPCTAPILRILPGEAWDLGHTADRTAWTGPEHARCNRAAGGRAAHAG